MSFFSNLFGNNPLSQLDRHLREEVERLLVELIDIGRKEDFLSEHPGGSFNSHCHHIRARAIGKRLNDVGGMALMQMARGRVRKKLGANLASHLDYAWNEIGDWKP
jgi:hypothetical protein